MSLILKKEEVFSEIVKVCDEVIHFVVDETRGFFYVTICDKENHMSYFGMLLLQDGVSLLADYFIHLQHFSYEEHLDTLKIHHYGKVLCYIRSYFTSHVILEKQAFMEQLLYQLLESLTLEHSKISVLSNPNHPDGFKLIFKVHDSGGFMIDSKKDQTAMMIHILKKYMANHSSDKVFENDFEYVLNKVSFSKNGVSVDYKNQLTKEMSLMSWVGYQPGISNSLIYEIASKVMKDETLVKKKKL